MHPSDRPASGERATRTRSLLAWAALGLGGSVIAGGCSPMQTAGPSYEPLYGVFPPGGAPAPPGKFVPPASAGQKKPEESPRASAAAGVPALPTTTSSTNNATLASHSALPGSPPALAIPAARTGAAAPTDNSRSNAAPSELVFPPPNPNPKVVPVPRDTGAALPAPTGGVQAAGSWQPGTLPALGATSPINTPAVNVPTAPTALTPDTFGAQLAQRGYRLIQQKQAPLAGGIHLVCLAAPTAQPEASTVFETTGPDFATAAQAILREAERRAAAR